MRVCVCDSFTLPALFVVSKLHYSKHSILHYIHLPGCFFFTGLNASRMLCFIILQEKKICNGHYANGNVGGILRPSPISNTHIHTSLVLQNRDTTFLPNCFVRFKETFSINAHRTSVHIRFRLNNESLISLYYCFYLFYFCLEKNCIQSGITEQQAMRHTSVNSLTFEIFEFSLVRRSLVRTSIGHLCTASLALQSKCIFHR